MAHPTSPVQQLGRQLGGAPRAEEPDPTATVCPGCGGEKAADRRFCRPVCEQRHRRRQRPLFIPELTFDSELPPARKERPSPRSGGDQVDHPRHEGGSTFEHRTLGARNMRGGRGVA
jgi:hypothetical protein